MSQYEADQSPKETRKKINKTIGIETHVNERLLEVCAYLGVTPHAYLVAKLGEAVSRDYVQFQVGKNMGSQDEFMRLMTQALIEKNNEDEE